MSNGSLSEGEMAQTGVCFLCGGTGVAKHGPRKGQRCEPCGGSGKMTATNQQLAVKAWQEHRRRRQVQENTERRDLL